MNRRPLGYELSRDLAGNPLISRRMSGTTSNYWFLSVSSSYLAFEDVSGWYGSKMGATDLWVLPKTFAGAVCCEASTSPLTIVVVIRHSSGARSSPHTGYPSLSIDADAVQLRAIVTGHGVRLAGRAALSSVTPGSPEQPRPPARRTACLIPLSAQPAPPGADGPAGMGGRESSRRARPRPQRCARQPGCLGP